ncbi:MAG: cellulase family glycosylhydrolase [Fibrobacter sp.]|nr:cellulase family glycosylhydrolase [Fibrobacter sp.]
MNFSFNKSVLTAGVLAMGLATLSFGRVGPVSAYGQLQAGTNSSGKGQIYGSCKGVSDGNEVAVQGMSLFWSIASDVGAPFWSDTYVTGLVENQNIQLIRAPMGVDEDWGAGNYFTNTSSYQGLMDAVVQSAIDNDIYVIIDFHSHCAENITSSAQSFFATMAQKWGKYDNVIFEIYNEPKNACSDTWFDLSGAQSYWTSKIYPYAESVISTIRQYSDNLILVGTPYFDQYTNAALVQPLSDANVAYTFHYYAGDDTYAHTTSKQGSWAEAAMNGGLSVFVSEWGNSAPSGNGGFNSSNSTTWYNWMTSHKLSGANWSVSNKDETASYFTTAGAWNYSESGKWVNANVFASLPTSYTACSNTTTSSSSVAASSSSVSSSSQASGTTDYIDDFEDGDNYAFTGGEWYAYTDAGDDGASTLSNSEGKNGGYNVILSGSSAGNSTSYVAGITGVTLSQGNNLYDPYVALGLGLNETQTAYDLSSCTAITYKYKGAAHNFKAEDTNVMDYGYHQTTKAASSSWKTATISWDALAQETWADEVTLSKARINKLTWEIKGTQPTYNYLYIDDVRCTGMSIVPVESPSSSSVAASSSSSAKSSSSTASSSSIAASSSSATSSASVVASSSSAASAAGYVINGSTSQTVVKNTAFETITITNVTSFSRDTWNLSSIGNINIAYADNTVTISGIVENWAAEGTYSETLTVNGETVTVSLNVVNEESTSIAADKTAQSLHVAVLGRTLHVSTATPVTVEVFDMQGRALKRFFQVNESVSLESMQSGSYIVRVHAGSMSSTKRISLR